MSDPTLVRTLEERTATLRRHILTMASNEQRIHIGGSMSIAELMAALFFHFLEVEGGERPRDHFILSKGHTIHTFHACLAELGKIETSEFSTLGQMGTRLAGHPSLKAPLVEFATGSLGHGLSVGIGIALAEQTRRLQLQDRRPDGRRRATGGLGLGSCALRPPLRPDEPPGHRGPQRLSGERCRRSASCRWIRSKRSGGASAGTPR